MSKADEMFLKTDFVNKNEETKKGKLYCIKYEDENCNYYIKFYPLTKEMKIQATLDLNEIKAINEKIKELGWYE